jgi:hypothetical protein
MIRSRKRRLLAWEALDAALASAIATAAAAITDGRR